MKSNRIRLPLIVTFSLIGDVDRAEAIVVHHVLERVVAVRQRFDGGAHALCSTRDDVLEYAKQQIGTVLIGKLQNPPGTQAAGGDLGIVVAPALFHDPDVQQKEIENIALKFALAEETDNRNAQSLLIDFRHAARHAARHHAAHVRVMRNIAHEADEPAVMEDRRRHVDVRQVRTAGHMGVVGDENVILVDVVAELFEQVLHQPHHGGDVDRQAARRLDDQPARRIDDRGRMVPAVP